VRTASHARVGGRAKVSVRGRVFHYGRTWPLQEVRLFIRGLCPKNQSNSWHSTPPLLHSPPLHVAINIAQYTVSPPPPPVLPFNIQYW